ncbi:MAG: amidohydrolase [Pseudomonadota bacterium]|nr:amidohydrolase [Pseudomonadota bacterium]
MNEAIARLLPGPLDIHAHVVPADLMRRLAGGARAGFGVEVTDGARRLMIGGEPMRMPVMPAMDNVEMRLKAMEEQGVAAQLVSPWVALCNYRLDEADGIWFAQTVNEAIADFCRAMPDRFAGIGAAPLQAPEKAAAMVAPMMGELGLLGVEINTTLGPETFLDDPSLDPFWAAAEEEGAFVFIHPSLGGTGKQFERYYLNNLIHNPLETTVAAAHLIFGGVMERFPRLKVCLVHGGGYLPYALGRFRRGRLMRAETKVSMSGAVEDAFRRFYFDTVTHSASALEFLVGEAGAEHVLLGSDYPFDMADPDLVGTVKRAELGQAAERLVLRGGAERVLGANTGVPLSAG